MTEDELQKQITEISAKVAPLQAQLNQIREERKQTNLARIEEIREEISTLVDEAEKLSQDTGLDFYRDTFIQGIDSGGIRYNGDPFWTASDYC